MEKTFMPFLKEIWVRVIVGIIFVPCIILICTLGGISLFIFVTLIVLFGLHEYHGIIVTKELTANRLIGGITAFLLCLDAWLESGSHFVLILTGYLLVTSTREVLRNPLNFSLNNITANVFGVFYIGLLGSFLILLDEWNINLQNISGLDEINIKPVILAFIIPWTYDTFAYFTGHFWCRKKLLPQVSPGKTIEGTIGGLLGVSIVSLTLGSALFPFISPFHCVILGTFGGLVAQLGDLTESLLKRHGGIKDSSKIIPGHGGVLDRFDSVLFTAPFIFYYQAYLIS